LNVPNGIISWSPDDTLVITSTSSSHIGTYNFILTAKDEQPLTTSTASFTLTITNTNTAPKLVSTLKDISLKHGESTIINLATNFTDEQNDPLTMTATYKYNGGNQIMPIPGEIFTMPSELQIDVTSTSITDTGSYAITVTVSDDFPSNVTSSFTLSVMNAAPKAVGAL
jgi:hypothetical protein